MNTIRFTLLVLLFAAADLSAADTSKGAPLFADETLVKGKGFEIKRSQLDEAVTSFKANLAARNEKIPLTTAEVEAKLLEKLVTLEVLKIRATAEDRAEAAKRADKLVADMQAQTVSFTGFIQQLQALGTTPEKFRAQVVDQLTGEQVIERELRPTVQIAFEDVKKFYDDNPKQFQQPEQLRVTQILFSTRDSITRGELSNEQKAEKRATAAKALARAKAGEDFPKLVKEFSDDAPSKDKGGEYTFTRGQMVPEFEAAAFSLAPGQISDVVVSIAGYHIIKLVERLPSKPVDFFKAEPSIKEHLIARGMEKQMPAYLDRVKQEAGVQSLVPVGK